MANPLLNAMGGGQPNMAAMFNQFRSNPMQFLLSRKINIPQEYQNSPKDMVQYLLNNGQMTQDGFNRLSGIVNQFGGQLN